MKTLSTLTLTMLLSAGAAFAANTTPTATPAGTATPASTASPAEKHHSMSYCEKQAKEKKLTGEAQKTYVKDCRAGKKTD